jgi:hypothetical protein
MTTPWLTDTEIDDRCEGKRQNAAKVRYLVSLGLTVRTKPNGKPIVERAHYEAVMAGLPSSKGKPVRPARQAHQPDAAGLVLAFQRRG